MSDAGKSRKAWTRPAAEAEIAPAEPTEREKERRRRLVAEIRAERATMKPVTIEEIIAWRDEGRRR